MKLRTLAIGAALSLVSAGSAAAQTVTLEFVDGHVNLVAQNAPMRAILTEWARLGKTQIVGADRLAGPPVTLEITGATERYALDVLLRAVPGYLLTARQTAAPGASAFDRIMILPTTSTPRPASTAATFGPPPPLVQDSPSDIFEQNNDAAVRAEEARMRAEMEARIRAAEQRLRTAEQVVGGAAGQPTPATTNGFVTIRPGGAPQPFVPATDPLPRPAAPQPAQPGATTPPNPFTTLPGSSRPGEVSPAPQQPGNRAPAPPDVDRF